MAGKAWKKRPSSGMFMKLFRYISGVNSEQKENQQNPPLPTEDGVSIQQLDEMTVYVKEFGGYAMRDWVWMKECKAFAEELNTAEIIELGGPRDIDFSQCLTAGYDSPMKFWNRRNEVMFKVTKPNEVE